VNDDRRLRDEVSDPELRELLATRPPLAELPPEVRARSRQRVRALAAVPAAAGLLMWVQHAALGAVLGLVVVGATQAPRILSRTTAAPPVEVTAPPVRPRAKPSTPPAEALPSSSPAPETASADLTTPPAATFSVAEKPGLDAELALLDSARRELETNPAAALGALERHRKQFLASTLWAEREILAVTALVRLGRRADAQARAESLRQRIPGSLYATRLKGILNARP